MIKNYLLIALRNFQRQKLFSLLNMFGLALGLASAILIFLYVSDELQYDSMHPYGRDMYRVGCTVTNPDGQNFENTATPGYWTRQLKETQTEVLQNVLIDNIGYPTSLHHKAQDKIILTEDIRWAEPGFQSVFYFHMLQGNVDKIFEDQNSMVLSETGARKLFGDRDPIGEIVSIKHTWATRGKEIDVKITGIYKDIPANSHFKPHYIINVNALRPVVDDFAAYMEGTRLQNSEWFENYLVLKPSTDPKLMEESLQKYADIMVQSDSQFVAAGWKVKPFLKNVSDLHFDEKNVWEPGYGGDKKYLVIFSAVAILILIIACINYMNLATARSARRAKEVGLRKSLGSRRREIAAQFFSESTLMTVASLVLALLLVIIFLQPFNQLAHKSFSLLSLFNPYLMLITFLVVVFMAIVSGSYPAIYLSAFRPADVLKGQQLKGKAAELFRKALVTIQYAISLILIISTFVVIRQMEHMQGSKLNEQGSQILSIRYGGVAPQEKFVAFKQAVLQDKDIQHVTMANHLPRLNFFGWIGVGLQFPEFESKDLQWNQLNVDYDFGRTYKLEFIAGRDFELDNLSDSSSLILNEAAVKSLNQPIEKIIGTSVTELAEVNRSYKVIGVVKDFPFRSMHQAVEPLALNPHVHSIDRIAYVELPAGKVQEKIKFIESKWKEVFPGVGFDYWFVSDEFNRMYAVEGTVSSLSKTFAVLAILITALGIFGLASYTAEQKTKEVGIRKVLGAAVSQVVGMFLWIFVKIFLVSAIIAIPAAYFLSDYWLKNFVYRADLSVWVFVVSLGGLLLITLCTISYETWKAARANPALSLRSE
jgi:putative ABC transport system permease protein